MSPPNPMAQRQYIAVLGAIIGITTLIAQFAIVVPATMDLGHSFAYAVLRFFSFFTILTNIVLVLIYLAATVKGHRWLAPFRKPITRASAAGAIFLVMVFFHFFIAPTLDHEGLLLVCDTVFHYVTPILFLAWFALYNRSGTLAWSALPKMLIAPALYLVWSLLRGLVVNDYIYDVLNVTQLGYPTVALGIAGSALALTVFNAGAIAIDKSLLLRRVNWADQ